MDVFSFRDRVVEDYGQFSRSFTQIRAPDLQAFVDGSYGRGEYWPSPLIQLNPSFVSGGRIGELVDAGLLHPECSRIFRWGMDEGSGQELQLHRHQREAIEIAGRGGSFVVTSGTRPTNSPQATQPAAKQRDSATRGARSRPGRVQGTAARLVGKVLLDKVRELDGCPKTELVRQCGYTQRRSDGSQRLNYTVFFEALLEARQADEKGRTRLAQRQCRPMPIAIDNPAGLKAEDLLRLPEGRRLNPAAQARRHEMAELLRQQEEKQEQRRQRREQQLAERRRLLGLDEPEAPEDMMRIAIRAGAPGSKR